MAKTINWFDRLYNEDEFEYVRFIAFQYYPEYSEVDGDEVICSGVRPEAVKYFSEILTGERQFLFSREDYESNTDIQQSIKLIGLDKEKLWYAIQYIHTLAFSWTTDCVPSRPSAHEVIRDLINALNDGHASITINRPGAKRYDIDKEVIPFISHMLDEGDKHFYSLYAPDYVGSTVEIAKDRRDQAICWQIYDEYNAFKCLFDKYCTDEGAPKRVRGQVGSRDKDLLVSRILLLTRVVEGDKFNRDRDALRSIINRCRNKPRPSMDSGPWEES